MSSTTTARSRWLGVDLAGGAAGQERQGRAEPFAAALAGVGDVGLDGRIEGARLLGDALLNAVELGVDQFEGFFDVPRRVPFLCRRDSGQISRGKGISAVFRKVNGCGRTGKKGAGGQGR